MLVNNLSDSSSIEIVNLKKHWLLWLYRCIFKRGVNVSRFITIKSPTPTLSLNSHRYNIYIIYIYIHIYAFIYIYIYIYIYLFIHIFIHSFIHPFIHSFIRSFMHSCIHSCMHCSFTLSSMHSFMIFHAFIYLFIYLFICCGVCVARLQKAQLHFCKLGPGCHIEPHQHKNSIKQHVFTQRCSFLKLNMHHSNLTHLKNN